MDKSLNSGLPTANIAINKSRLKQYEKNSSIPIYYLKKSSEFQIELFNPTTNSVLAIIELNNKPISQGGLVLRPGERVFLDRYLDVARKFKFDTYDVADSNEVKKAIKDNGDFKVEFYSEKIYTSNLPYCTTITQPNYEPYWGYFGDTCTGTLDMNTNSAYYNSTDMTYSTTNMTNTTNLNASLGKTKRKKTVETGRVEKGSHSNQKMETVNKEWELFPFHTIEYKLLPISQKVNTAQDIKVKQYCTSCGSKIRKGDNFCGKCGNKV